MFAIGIFQRINQEQEQNGFVCCHMDCLLYGTGGRKPY
jgi:hypothetical protein